jgi:hypothetical protein
MTSMSTQLTHLKNHVNYPANRQQVIAACNGMMDADEVDRKWVTGNLPEGTYKTADDVLSALLRTI